MPVRGGHDFSLLGVLLRRQPKKYFADPAPHLDHQHFRHARWLLAGPTDEPAIVSADGHD